jgi:RNA polymerase sigma-70 factor (ECF subfamily)
MSDRPDKELIEAAQRGDRDAFEEIVRRSQKELFAFLVKVTGRHDAAEDVFQETFIGVFENIARFDVERPFRPWLFTIAANCARDRARREKIRKHVSLDAESASCEEEGSRLIDILKAEGQDPVEQLSGDERLERLRRALGELPDEHKLPLVLFYHQGFRYEEIAQMLDLPLGTVKSRLNSAVAKLLILMREP